MDRKLTESQKETLRGLREWGSGYIPCDGTETHKNLIVLQSKSYVREIDGKWYVGKKLRS